MITKFLPFFLRTWFPMFCFAAGAATIGSGAEPSAVVSEPITEPSEGGAEPGPEPGQSGTGEPTQPPVAASKQDQRVIPQDVRAHLTELKKTNPALATKINDALYAASALRQVFPGGLKEAKELKAAIETAGGVESFGNLKQNFDALKSGQDEIDQKLSDGDASVIDAWVNGAPEGFAKIVPVAIQKWSAIDPEGYSRHHASVMISTMIQQGFVSDFNDVVRIIKRSQDPVAKEAIESLGNMGKFINEFGEVAKSQPKPKQSDPNAEANKQREATLKQQETELFTRGVGTDFLPFRNEKISAFVKTLRTGKPALSSDAMDTIYEKVTAKIARDLAADTSFNEKYNDLCNARDKAGALRLLKSRWEPKVEAATRNVYKGLYGEATLGAQKQKPGAQTASAKPAPGWVKIAATPKPSEINFGKTNSDMTWNKSAILKDGRKVFWGDRAPTA